MAIAIFLECVQVSTFFSQNSCMINYLRYYQTKADTIVYIVNITTTKGKNACRQQYQNEAVQTLLIDLEDFSYILKRVLDPVVLQWKGQ